MSLVSNENFSEILWPSGCALDQVTWAKIAPKLLYLWCHSQKICNHQPKFFFSGAGYYTWQIFWGFEQLSSAIGRGVMALV